MKYIKCVMMEQFKNLNGDIIEVGDIIIGFIFSNPSRHIVLGFIDNGIIISVKRCNTSWNNVLRQIDYELNEEGDVVIDNELNNHNSKYILCGISDLLIVQKNSKIPDKLCKFIK